MMAWNLQVKILASGAKLQEVVESPLAKDGLFKIYWIQLLEVLLVLKALFDMVEHFLLFQNYLRQIVLRCHLMLF